MIRVRVSRAAHPAQAAALLLALMVSLAGSIQLSWSDRLGFYQDDFAAAQNSCLGLRSLTESSSPLIGCLLTDEPFFSAYQQVRFWILGAESAWPHHLVAGSISAINSWLFFVFVARLGGSFGLAFAALLLFATYPANGEAKLLASTAGVPALLWLLLTCHFWLSWLRRGSRLALAAAWLCYPVAVLTQEAAMALVCVLFALWVGGRDHHRWREAWWAVLPFILTNAAYVVVRWWTLGTGLGADRLSLENQVVLTGFPGRALESLSQSVGAGFGGRTLRYLAEAPDAATLVPIGVLFGLGGAIVGLLGWRPARMAWFGAGTVTTIATVLVARAFLGSMGAHPDGWRSVFGVALVWLGCGLLAGVVGLAGGNKEARRLGGMVLLGAIWFAATLFTKDLFGITGHPALMPSAGLALGAAALSWLPGALVERPRPLVQGLAAGVCTCLALSFHLTSLGETRRWEAAARYVDRVREGMLDALPTPPVGEAVIVLDVAESPNGVPVLGGQAWQAATRLWYGEQDFCSSTGLVPGKETFWALSCGDRPYEQLHLFRYRDGRLARIDRLQFDDGTEAGTRYGRSREGTALQVTAGKRVTSARESGRR